MKLSGVFSGWKPAIHDKTGSVTIMTSFFVSRDGGGVTSLENSLSVFGVDIEEVLEVAKEIIGPPALLTLGQVMN